MKLTDKVSSLTTSVLVYGSPKTGKTQLAGALSEFKKLIWVDMENGYSTLLRFPGEWKERIEIISLPDTRSYPIAIETCLKLIKGGPIKICDTHGKVSCPQCNKNGLGFAELELNKLDSDTVVVFDSLTQLTNSAIAHITQGKPDDYKLDFTDWGNLGKLMDIFLSHIQQATFNVVCISHEAEVELEDGRMKIVPVAGTRAFSRNTAKYFSNVIYAEVKNKKHNFYSSTTSANNLNTGSRTGISLESITGSPLIALFKSPPTLPTSKSPLISTLTSPPPLTSPITRTVASARLSDATSVVIPPEPKPANAVASARLNSILAGIKISKPTT